jgi:hypothetical protein
MKWIDPTYLRFVYSELDSSKLDKTNLESIPEGLGSFFEKLFRSADSVKEKEESLQKFTYLALFHESLSLDFITALSSKGSIDWYFFIQKHSKFLQIDSLHRLKLFHSRFQSFILQRNCHYSILTCVNVILSNIDTIPDRKWVIENKGYYLFLVGQINLLFQHLIENQKLQSENWWVQDLDRLLELIYQGEEGQPIDFTKLCDLLRNCFEYTVQRKGVRVIALNSSAVNWDILTNFFDTTRFQYELAIEFSRRPKQIPKNWMEMILDEGHPLSYTFSYVWKYSQFNLDEEVNRNFITQIWNQGSPYQRILVVMIWGYRKLKGDSVDWLDQLTSLTLDWDYLKEEKEHWESSQEAKQTNAYQEHFNRLKSNLNIQHHYIFDHYWELFEFNDKLNEDVNYLWDSDLALEIAFWIYKHPVWEIGKIANEIVIKRLQIKEMRKETIDWLRTNWEMEEFYALGEVIFEIRNYINEEDFLEFVFGIVKSESCQIRGAFVSDLTTYLACNLDSQFCELVVDRVVPQFIEQASDIWEIQELIRLFKQLVDVSAIDYQEANRLLNSIELVSTFEQPMEVDYNDFWQKAEKIKGNDESN